MKTAAYKLPHLKALVKALKSFTLSVSLMKTNLILCSQAETIVSYSKSRLSLNNLKLIILLNIIYSLFPLTCFKVFPAVEMLA